jgi:sugar phosphate isomerase/epimerase
MAIHPRVSVNPMTTISMSLDDTVTLWRDLGVHTVGLNVTQLESAGWIGRVDALRASGIRVEYLNYGIPCAVTDDAGWRSVEPTMVRAVETAAELGAPTFYFCTGAPGALRWEDAVDMLGHRLVRVLDAARDAGVAITLENGVSSRPELGFLHSARDTIAAAHRLGTDVCIDLYGCWVEPALQQTLAGNLEVIRLVQISDFVVGTLTQPNRWVPGDGDLPLERLLDDVLGAGYSGVIDLELLGPAIDAEGARSALRRGTEWLTAALDERGA